MADIAANNKRIAKNTLMLYIRMLLVMAVTLYTSRIVLNVLGVEDYGIYNIVGSVVIAFSFISGPLGTATQRFLSYSLGENDNEKLNSVFSSSLMIYAILAVILLILIEIAGTWFLYNKMQIPDGRLSAAFWAFQFSILSFIINLFKTCYDALIISHERMSFFAYLGIAEVILRLLNALALTYATVDKLILYALNMAFISGIILICAIIYSRRKMPNIKIHRVKDKDGFRQILNFSGWSMFGSLASMTANQGLNILLNVFHGVTVNAAMGIANQVSSAVNQFVMNFQTAFRPQLVKSYAAGNIDYLHKLIFRTCKFSFFLLFAIACPIVFNIDFILKLWLGDNVPELTAVFCSMILLYSLLETLSAPLWMTVQATGNIKKYQLVISSLIFLNIIFSYIFLKLGFSPEIVLEVKCCLDVTYLVARLVFVRNMVGISIKQYLRDVLLPIIKVVLITIIITYLMKCYVFYKNGLTEFMSSSILILLEIGIFIWITGLDKSDRNFIRHIILKSLHKKDNVLI